MSDIVISVENLGKRYRIAHQQVNGMRYKALRDVLADKTQGVARRLWSVVRRQKSEDRDQNSELTSDLRPLSSSRASHEDFWALKDVSFEVRQGEVLGIIGRNGAGKSTLLKILSRITEPTEGRVRIKGRVASLLEVGTGFHPELTGRENIFLNGAILGMSKVEIKSRFDEIVAFAEIEKFLDTPVKRYSSGMYVRLAFAVAAHLEPEILIIDEVLAVGDAEFQKKCLGKMGEVAKGGRTILFVSHNVGAISMLCSRGIMLGRGKKVLDSSVPEVVDHYVQGSTPKNGEYFWPGANGKKGSENVRLRSLRILSEGRTTGELPIDRPIVFQVVFETLKPGLRISTGLHVVHPVKGDVLSTANFPSASLVRDPTFGQDLPTGIYCASCTLPESFLNEGEYSLNVVLFQNATSVAVFEQDVLRFRVFETGAMRGEWSGVWIGVVRPRLEWKTKVVQS